MAKSFPSTIVAFTCLILACSSAFVESSDSSPFIVAHKKVYQKKLNADLERVSVSIDIYNRGSEAAYDVTLNDGSWPKEIFDSVVGNTSKSWEKLDGGSLVSHSFELESKTKTVYYGAPALITYRIPTTAKIQEAYSTPTLPLNILSDPIGDSNIEIAKRLAMTYGSHTCVLLFMILCIHVFKNPSKSTVKKKH